MPFEILRNNITKMQVDAIVNSTSSYPSIGSGVDHDINMAAGPNLFQERASFGLIEKCQAILTKAYNLPSSYVIHVSAPIYIDGNHNEQEDLYNTYLNALNIANKHNITSIAFPLISTGTYQFPRGKALEIALSAIKSFLDQHDMMIYLVVYDDASYQISLDRFDTIMNYLEPSFNDTLDIDTTEMFDAYEEPSISYNKIISHDRSLEDIIDNLDETFTMSLFRLIDERELNDVEVYKKANIDRKLFSKIKSNMNYQPSKITVIAFAIALELNIDQTKDLLNTAGYALSTSSKFDKIIYYFIEHEIYDLYEINQVLFAFDQKTIGGID